MLRRLPVYLLIDCSESMAGPPLEAVEAGVAAMISALRKNPYALETAYLSVITFAAKARVQTELTELIQLRTPQLSVRPGTSLGAALDLLRDRLGREVVKTSGDDKGDYKPLVFILTDGQPTDDWRGPLSRLRAAKSQATVYAIGCGEDVDYGTLSEIADVCIRNDSLTPESLSKLFVWLSASVQNQSASPDKPLSLDKVPLGGNMELVDPDRPPGSPGQGGVVYLHATCCRNKRLYLMRYRRRTPGGMYVAHDSARLPEDFFSDGTMKAPPVDSNTLEGWAPCPWCGAQAWCRCCVCGTIMCRDHKTTKVRCPKCDASLELAAGSVSMDGSGG